MLKKVLFLTAILLLSVSVASAKTFTVKLHQASMVEGKELKPGNYKVELTDSKATITNGKETVETAIKTEESNERFGQTSVRYTDAEGKMKIREIRVGGTNTKVVFN
ncbi:MAG: hypothetical protein KIT83_09295 [Bryobacterales bacterium]|nr:hypothetical protein [Bryobacterales bacterium]